MRVPFLIGVAGSKGVGKTYTTMQDLMLYVRGYGNAQARNVLIFDVNNEFSNIKSMPLSYIKYFAHKQSQIKQIRRILPFKDNGQEFSISEKQDVLSYILQHFMNGLLLVEDYYNYTSDSMKRDIIGLLTSQRHKNVDVIIHSQGVGRLFHPKLVQQYTYIRLHPTIDNIARYKDRIEEHYEVFAIAEKLVNLKNSLLPEDKRYYSLYVNMQKSKIEGAYTKIEILKSIEDYIYENESITIKRIMAKKNDEGKKIYNYKEALELEKKRLLEKYTKLHY